MSGINIIKKTDSPPSNSFFNMHYFCDYIEFIALVENDVVSHSDIYDKYFEDEQIIEKGSEDGGSKDDNWESRIRDWFTLLEIRQEKYKEFYPYFITSNTITLKSDLDEKMKMYIFFLLSSTRKYINDNNILTTDFEYVSKITLEAYLPNFAKVFQFGKSNIEHDRYKGTIANKIDTLANDLNCDARYKDHFFSTHNTGDGGLDLVAWIPFHNLQEQKDTNYNNIQIYLGQCATGKDWLDKQDDTHKFPEKYITFDGHVNYVMFIPYDGRNCNNTFNEEANMGKYLLFDRFRLLTMISDFSFLDNLPSFPQVVDKIIEYEEDIV